MSHHPCHRSAPPAMAPGKVGWSRRRWACCAGQELVTIVPYPSSHRVLPGGETLGNPLYQAPCLPGGGSIRHWHEQGTAGSLAPGKQHFPTGALPAELHRSWQVQALERTQLSARWILSLPARAGTAAAAFLPTLSMALLVAHAP